MDNYFSEAEKIIIARQIKNISLEVVNKEMDKLIEIGENANSLSPRSRIGNNIVDYFTFIQRLETKGKYNASFYDFLSNIDEFKNKKYIQTMIKYYHDVKNKKGNKNMYIVYKEVYNICISAINIMRPLNCMELYTKYKSKKVLNFCAGWGGSMVAAAALNLDTYYGIDINNDLQVPYINLVSYLKTKSTTKFDIKICDAVTYDYTNIDYDTVFSSPPYYFIEKYANMTKYASKKDMDDKFYKPLFIKTYSSLKIGGHYIINVCKEVYVNILIKLLGEAHEMFPLKKSKRQNNYMEMVYVWIKTE